MGDKLCVWPMKCACTHMAESSQMAALTMYITMCACSGFCPVTSTYSADSHALDTMTNSSMVVYRQKCILSTLNTITSIPSCDCKKQRLVNSEDNLFHCCCIVLYCTVRIADHNANESTLPELPVLYSDPGQQMKDLPRSCL